MREARDVLIETVAQAMYVADQKPDVKFIRQPFPDLHFTTQDMWRNLARAAIDAHLTALSSAGLELEQGWIEIGPATPRNVPYLLYSPPKNISDWPGEVPDYRISRVADFCWATHYRPIKLLPPLASGGG